MKALALREYNHFVYEDVPMPEIAAGEVLIQVRACGICGSDVHGMDGPTVCAHRCTAGAGKRGLRRAKAKNNKT